MPSAVISHNEYLASGGDANVHTATADELVTIRMSNASGGQGTITGLSVSSTSATQEPGGNLLADGDKVTIDDGETIVIKGVVLDATEKYIVLHCSVDLDVRVDGVTFA